MADLLLKKKPNMMVKGGTKGTLLVLNREWITLLNKKAG